MNPTDSFNSLIPRVQTGDDDACTRVYHRFADQLLHLARQRFTRAFQARLDAEDVVQSVFRSFFRGCQNGQFDLENWDHLWGVLAAIAHHKCSRRREREHAACRDVRREFPLPSEAAHADFHPRLPEQPGPEESVLLADLVEQLVAGLKPPGPQILALQLEGHTLHEISQHVGCSFSTVRRTLDRIRERLRKLCQSSQVGDPPDEPQ